MTKLLPTLTLALFAVAFNAHAASHGGAAPMKADAASMPASGAMPAKDAKHDMKKTDKKDMKKEEKKEEKK